MHSKTIWDKQGNRIGEDVITTDRDGLTRITHYNNRGVQIGRSYETRDYRGDVYIIHEDACGNRLARSTVERDWWGDYYVRTQGSTGSGHPHLQETDKEDVLTDAENSGGGLYGIVMLLVKIFAVLFIGSFLYGIIGAAGLTVWAFLLIPVLNQSSHLSQIGPAFIVILAPVMFSYFIYVGILLFQRWKKKIAWKDFFLFVLRWAVAGPFAYRKLIRQIREKKDSPSPRSGSTAPSRENPVRCPGCGTVTSPGQRFCTRCGTSLSKAP